MKPNESQRAIAPSWWLALVLLMLLTSGCSSVSTQPAPPPPVVVQCPVIPELSDSAKSASTRKRDFSAQLAALFDSWLVMPTPSWSTSTNGSGDASPSTKP